jgi:hypothetical protein
LLLHVATRVSHQPRQQRLGQALPGLAIAGGIGRARRLAGRHAMRQQPSHGAVARLVGAEYLPQEDPQRYAWRINTVAIEYFELVEQALQPSFAQHLRERQTRRSVVLRLQGSDFGEKASLRHDGPPCRWVACLITSHSAKERPFLLPQAEKGLSPKPRAIRLQPAWDKTAG